MKILKLDKVNIEEMCHLSDQDQEEWTETNKMKLNQEKSKVMIFNLTNN